MQSLIKWFDDQVLENLAYIWYIHVQFKSHLQFNVYFSAVIWFQYRKF